MDNEQNAETVYMEYGELRVGLVVKTLKVDDELWQSYLEAQIEPCYFGASETWVGERSEPTVEEMQEAIKNAVSDWLQNK